MAIDASDAADWSREVRAGLERRPRDTWRKRPAPIVELWLETHDRLRQEIEALKFAAETYRRGRLTAVELAALAAPRLRAMVARLRGHHEVEEFHYFPALRGLEPSLAGGFDSLMNDHERLDAHLAASLGALDDLFSSAGAVAGNEVARRHAAERYVQTADELCRALTRHLHDEEDLIIPLLLDRALAE